jgi:Luciferase-like monooxygenase/Recombinase
MKDSVAVEIIRRLWSEDRVTHSGRHWQFSDAAIAPRPLRAPRPPIIIGAQVDAAIARAAKINRGPERGLPVHFPQLDRALLPARPRPGTPTGARHPAIPSWPSIITVLSRGDTRSIRTKTRRLSTGATRGGIPFGRGALYYLLSNHFYIGEVKYKNEILPGEQPPIMDRALFDAVRQKSLAQWSHRTTTRNKSDHLLTGLLFDDAGHRMIPTHATKAGVRYRYYVSTPVLHGEAKTVSAGSVSRVP